MPERVTELALGENHLVLLSSSGAIYTAGSNEFGQLGVKNQRLPHYYEHPLTLARTHYTEKPMRVEFFNQSEQQNKLVTLKQMSETSPVTAVAAGDQFSLALTMSGKVYAWGL